MKTIAQDECELLCESHGITAKFGFRRGGVQLVSVVCQSPRVTLIEWHDTADSRVQVQTLVGQTVEWVLAARAGARP